MNTEIYIEGSRLDLNDDISALFTYSVDDVQDFGTRETSFSKTIVFPGSARNNQLFGQAFEFTAYNDFDYSQPNVGYNFNAAKTARCIVLVNCIQIFKGVIRLMEIKSLKGAIEYETSIIGELGGLFASIGNKLITGNIPATDDLDFSAYNQAWTFINITNSWAALASSGGGSGVYFPLVDYGKCTTGGVDYSFQAMRPAFYAKEYVDKIITNAGYTYDCPFFSTSFFKRLVIPHSRDQVFSRANLILDNREIGFTDIVRSNSVSTVMTANMALETNVVLVNFTAAYATYPTGAAFTYTGPTGKMQIAVRVKGRAEGGEGKVVVLAMLYKNATTIFGRQFTLTGTATGTGYTSPPQDFDLPISVLETLTSGDVLTVKLTASYPGTAPSFSWHVYLTNESQMTVTAQTFASVPAAYGNSLNMNDMLPVNISQRDFIMSIVKAFNLRVIEDPLIENHVKIMTWNEAFDNSDPLFWTDKMDRGSLISLKPMSEVNARYFNFKYAEDSDYDNERYKDRFGAGYADRTVDVGLDFVHEKKDVSVIFASSPLVAAAGAAKTLTRIMKLNNGVEERTASKIRILQAKRIAVANWNVLQDDLATVIGTTGFYGYAGHVDDPDTPQGADLNFGAPNEIYWTPANPYLATNLVNEFYTPYLAEITDKDSKLLIGFFRLSPLDIMNIDFNKSIAVDGQLWRLNKVIDYDPIEEGVTKVELLKVINLSY